MLLGGVKRFFTTPSNLRETLQQTEYFFPYLVRENRWAYGFELTLDIGGLPLHEEQRQRKCLGSGP